MITIEVTTHISVPDDWTRDSDLTTSEGIIQMLHSEGIATEITGCDDTIVSAKILPPINPIK